ncbi:pal1 [Fusarium sporotrichioides]|uniref:Pal1 n=1 Tax=Fusarium sporotrichioides TaxID=5514 RepID=A0A395RF10_FUSSP|nr:pal1 [Fusarium sporotrichioides]
MASSGNLSRTVVRAAAQVSESSIRTSATRSDRYELQGRSLYLWVWPAPVSSTERRSILKALQQHGPVEYFKWLPGQGSSKVLGSIFISLMKESQDAAKAISSSPFSITVPKSGTKTTSVVKMDGRKAEFQKQDSSKAGSSEFLIEISETLTYRHEQSARNSPLTRPWPEFVVKSPTLASKTLQHSLPDSIAAVGLRHWDVDLGVQEVADNKRFEREQMRNWLPSKIKDLPTKEKAEHGQTETTHVDSALGASTQTPVGTSIGSSIDQTAEVSAKETTETLTETPTEISTEEPTVSSIQDSTEANRRVDAECGREIT